MRKRAKSADEKLYSRVAKRRRDPLTRFFRVLSGFGSLFFASTLSSLIYRTGDKSFAKRFFIGTTVAKISTHTLKRYFGRSRPEDSIVETSSNSFPSGHTTTAFASAAILGSRYKEGKSLLYSVAALTGLSRLYLGAHYLSDIIAGAFIGEIFGKIFSEESKQT